MFECGGGNQMENQMPSLSVTQSKRLQRRSPGPALPRSGWS